MLFDIVLLQNTLSDIVTSWVRSPVNKLAPSVASSWHIPNVENILRRCLMNPLAPCSAMDTVGQWDYLSKITQ